MAQVRRRCSGLSGGSGTRGPATSILYWALPPATAHWQIKISGARAVGSGEPVGWARSVMSVLGSYARTGTANAA
eukprot:2866027-Pyramimonas_sp.AAC.1